MTKPYDPSSFGEEPTQPVYKRPWFVVVAGLAAMAVLGTVIGGPSAEQPSEVAASSSSPSTSGSRAPATSSSPVPTSQRTTEAPTPTPSEATPSAVDFVMPDVVGLDLQSAQNLIQTHGVFFTVSHDLRGSRNQVLDSNWRVCTQNIPPGQEVTGEAEGRIDFGVVKREESCP